MTTGLVGLGLAGLLLLIIVIRTGRFWIGWLFSAATGLGALGLVNLTSVYTGVALPLSLLSLGSAVVGGIPGVVALLMLRLIWPM